MPKFTVKDPDSGRTLTLTGDSAPTEKELTEIFSQFKDAPKDQPRTAADAGEALITNLPTNGIGQALVRGLPAAGGGMAGAAAGAAMGVPFGPLGIAAGGIIGSGLGGAAGESVRQAVSQATAGAFPENNYPMATPGQVLKEVGAQGAMNAGGEAIGLGVGAAARAIRPAANRLGAQAIRIGSGVPTQTAEAALKDPSMLLRARPAQEVGKEIGEYLGSRTVADTVTDPLTGAVSNVARPGGLKYNVEGLQEIMPGKFVPSTGDKFNMINGAMSKLADGSLDVQEALVVRQQAMKMLSTPSWQNPELAAAKTEISKSIDALDKFINPQLPEIGGLRGAYRDSMVGEEFSNWLPLNRNSSPNVLRSVVASREAALGAAAALGAGSGSPLGLAALPLISPKFYGTAIKGAALLGKVPGDVPATIYRVGTAGAGSALADAYARQRPATP